MRFGGFVLVVCFAAAGVADTVTGVSCATFGSGSAVTATSSCYSAGPNGFTQAASSGSVTLPAGVFNPLVVSGQTSVSALQGSIAGYSLTSAASANATEQLNLNTGGSGRQGLLEVTFQQTSWQAPYDGLINEQFTIGSYTYNCAAPCLNSNGLSLPTFWIPIELGADFGFSLSQSVTTIASSFSGLTSANIGAQVSVLAFEANGTTAVQLFDPPAASLDPVATPEPATAGMFAFALAALGAIVLARKRISLK